ncbi:hypothetical protein Tco_0960386 [Tanacetum coccineum]
MIDDYTASKSTLDVEMIPYVCETNEPLLRSYHLWKKARYEEALRKSDQMHQTFKNSSLAMTHKLDDIRELPKSLTKKKIKKDLECEIIMVYKLPVTYPEEVDETLGTLMEVEPLDGTQLEDLGLNTCNRDVPLSSRKVPSFDEMEPQPNPLPNCPYLDISLGDKRGPEPPIKPDSSDRFRMR